MIKCSSFACEVNPQDSAPFARCPRLARVEQRAQGSALLLGSLWSLAVRRTRSCWDSQEVEMSWPTNCFGFSLLGMEPASEPEKGNLPETLAHGACGLGGNRESKGRAPCGVAAWRGMEGAGPGSKTSLLVFLCLWLFIPGAPPPLLVWDSGIFKYF